MSSRRNNLCRISAEHKPQHAGLWLDKFLEDQGDEKAKHAVIDTAAAIPVPDAYHRHFERWQRALRGNGAQLKLAEVTGRMVLGTGAESVLETAVTLHRAYGVPYIPGSALKGLAAAYARQRLDATVWGSQTKAYQTMFGTTDSAGYITFFDALYVPSSGYNGQPLAPDVITVHHKGYYEGKNEAPADWDSPTIIPFTSATGCYLLALGGDPRWTTRAFEILEAALRDMGVGAKTSSGYGRMRLLSENETTKLDTQRADALARLPHLRQSPPARPQSQSEAAENIPVLSTPPGVIGEEPLTPMLPPEAEQKSVDPSNATPVETRMPGTVVDAAAPGQQGRIVADEQRRYDYDIEDIIGVVPTVDQHVLFKPGKKKVARGRDKKNVNWAYDVEVKAE